MNLLADDVCQDEYARRNVRNVRVRKPQIC